MATPDLDTLNEQQLRDLARQLLARVDENQTQIARRERLINLKDTTIAQLTHEIAVLRRFRFGKKSEQLSGVQGSLLEEAVAADIAAIEEELEQLTVEPRKTPPAQQPKRQALPPELPGIEIHHEPESSTCACGCQLDRLREDVAEKLDYIPGVAQVERHIRGKWACRQCETLTQAPAPAHVIDKGLASTGLG